MKESWLNFALNSSTFSIKTPLAFPGTILNTPTFGRITGTTSGGRVMQFGLKLLF